MRKARPAFEQVTGRRSGRTLAMVKALPETGAIVVVHNTPMREYVRRMIFDVRGGETLKHTTIMVITRPEDVHRMHGRDEPIVVDHAWHEHAADGDTVQRGTREALRFLIDRQEARNAQRS